MPNKPLLQFPEFDNLLVIVRSAYERTEEACVQLVKDQVPEDRVVVIHERPFSAALQRAYKIGIEYDLPWTLCLDADVFLRKGAIKTLTQAMLKCSPATLGVSGYVVDKLRGGRHPGGLHFYRTALLQKAVPLITNAKDASFLYRPESHVKMALKSMGHEWVYINDNIGIHDFEQFYSDIFRKTVVRSMKSPKENLKMLQNAKSLSRVDLDFLVATWGIRVGMNGLVVPNLDSQQLASEAKILLAANKIAEKDPYKETIVEGYLNVEKILSENNALNGIKSIWIENPIVGKREIYKWFRSSLWRTGRLITRLGLRMQKLADQEQTKGD